MTAAQAHQDSKDKGDQAAAADNAPALPPGPNALFEPHSEQSSGTVSVEGKSIAYDAYAGTLVVHPEGWDDTAWRAKSAKDLEDKKGDQAEASMFYVAYFKKGAPSADRPITFLFNGGPGSSTVWLHMGAFGPRRIITSNDSHTPAAPYQLVNNDYSLLDASDLVFIDAPGTGFSRVAGKDKEKAFYGVDQDAHAFSEFVRAFLTKYDRWNSPKYLFGESYGTPRSAVLVNDLETGNDVDVNGVVLLSQILNFDLSIDTPSFNPGSDEAYIVGLPTFAATAWYHNRLPGTRPADLEAFLAQVEQFANTDYAAALQKGSELDPATKTRIAQQLSQYIGIPAAYIEKSNLRIDGGQFSQQLQIGSDLTTGRLDSRFSGPSMDPLEKEADYDPQSAAISSAYVSAFNDYARRDLHYGLHQTYKPEIDVFKDWDFSHKQPGMPFAIRGATNVMPDLAQAMKYNPDLKVMLNGGYFDLATPFYEGWYEMHHLPIPDSLQNNIEYHYYQSGHMVYANTESLKQLHDNVAAFIRKTDNLGG
ncbi:peptidase S10 [Hephaestia sp. CMS5P-6]|nr:peptidase S10 [Hephaestia mangrovi]